MPGSGVDEPEDHLRPGVPQVLIRLLGCGPIHPLEIGHGQHSAGGCLRDHFGHTDERVAAQEVGECGDHRGFVPVVDFLGDPRADFIGHRPDVDGHPGRGGSQPHEGDQQLGIGEVIAYRLRHTGILDLHRHHTPVAQDGAVHLPDRCRRDRRVFELGETLYA